METMNGVHLHLQDCYLLLTTYLLLTYYLLTTPGGPHRVVPEPVGENAWRYSDYPADEFMVDRVSLEARCTPSDASLRCIP